MIKICCLSDLHGYLPEVPTCDLLLLGGDYCPTSGVPSQMNWLKDKFDLWLWELAERGIQVVGVAGNHDFIFEKRPDLVPELKWTYLQDNGTNCCGFNIWGSPYQPVFGWWAFNENEFELARIWDKIPSDTDILLLHGPPYGIGDLNAEGDHCGSPSLLVKIKKIRPRLVVAGHIHESRGIYGIDGNTTFINASYLDMNYRPYQKPPIIVELNT